VNQIYIKNSRAGCIFCKIINGSQSRQRVVLVPIVEASKVDDLWSHRRRHHRLGKAFFLEYCKVYEILVTPHFTIS
jgi:hypothetical protein